MRILLVDDDPDLVDLLAFALKRAGFLHSAAHDTDSARRTFTSERPDLVVLDIGLGRDNGLDLLREIRQHSDTPVILLTGRGSEDDKVRGLELGADDYLTKPFSHRELIARIRVQLRHSGRQVPKTPAMGKLEEGPLMVNLAEYTAYLEGRTLRLTATEFRLLAYLMSHAGSVVPTRALLAEIWGYSDAMGADVVRVTVHRLRRKLEEAGGQPSLLRTVAGVGVLLKPRPEA